MKELVKRLNQMAVELPRDYPLWANAALGNFALKRIKDRIVGSGIAADGSSYKPYSTKPMLVGASSFRTKKGAKDFFGSKKKRRELQWVIYRGHKLAVLQGGYKQLRQLENNQVAHKSFLRTNQMWPSIHTLGTTSK